MSHFAIDEAVYTLLPYEEAIVVVGRHRYALCFLAAADGSWTLLALGTGDLQGDRAAPDKFVQTFDPQVARWIENT